MAARGAGASGGGAGLFDLGNYLQNMTGDTGGLTKDQAQALLDQQHRGLNTPRNDK